MFTGRFLSGRVRRDRRAPERSGGYRSPPPPGKGGRPPGISRPDGPGALRSRDRPFTDQFSRSGVLRSSCLQRAHG